MNELLVIKSPQFLHREATGFSFDAEEVVGVFDSGKAITKYGYEPDSSDYEDVIKLEEGQSDRIIDAYERTAASPPELKEFINCHMFAYYALGKALALKRYNYYPSIPLSSVLADSLRPGAPYSTVLPNGIINHSLIGIDDSSESLSVLGDNGIFAIMNNETLKELYEAERIVSMHLISIDDQA